MTRLVEKLRIGVVVGSTRPGRRGDQVAEWVAAASRAHVPAVDVEVVDVAAQGLPLLDEPVPAAIGDYRNPHTRAWSDVVRRFDGFVFVVPEYNHSAPAAVKNAIDYLFTEWNDKAAGFVGYGLHGGVRAVEHLRGALAEVKVACVRSQVALSLFTDFAIDDMTAPGTFTPAEHHTAQLQRTVDEVVSWSAALRAVRTRGDGASGSDEAPFTMLIEFEVPPPRQHEFADRLRTYIAQSLPAVDGFLSARVQASVDGGTVINYAQWTSRAAWEKATGLSATETGKGTDRNWAESRRDQWFDEAHGPNPVVALLTEVGGSTRSVTAFDRSAMVESGAGVA